MTVWTDAELDLARRELGDCGDTRTAANTLTRLLGREVTPGALRDVLRRRGAKDVEEPAEVKSEAEAPDTFSIIPISDVDSRPAAFSKLGGKIHVVIGDTQAKAGVPTAHLTWIGRYIVDHFAGQFSAEDVRLLHLGDHWDMPSLSSYDKGKRAMEGRRYRQDIDAGNAAFDLLNEPLRDYNRTRRSPWEPSRHFFLGNHEDRITRAAEDDAQLDGALSLDDLNAAEWGWTVMPFLEPVVLEGVAYAHYFYNPMSGKPYGGENLYNRLKIIGHSFTMGHQQGVQHAIRVVGKTRHHGLVVGSSYLHEEKYLGPQGNNHWRGIVVCHQVEEGRYDPMFVSLEYLCRRYTNRTLADFMRERQ